jgi:hypothetical protein
VIDLLEKAQEFWVPMAGHEAPMRLVQLQA